MKKILALSVMCVCLTTANAQFLKKLRSKIDQSATDVKDKVKEKAVTAPDRVIDHAAEKVETKSASKIDKKENKANSKVDKTVDKVDSIKIKKAQGKESKDSVAGIAQIIYLNGYKNKTNKNMVLRTKDFSVATTLFYDKPRYLFS